MTTLLDLITPFGPCGDETRPIANGGEARRWLAAAQYLTIQDAWRLCPRGDWLLWLAAKLNVPGVQMAAYACADLAVRVFAADAMDAAKLPEQAAKLRAIAPIVDADTAWAAVRAAEAAARAAEAAAWAAWAAWAAVRAAAWAAWAAAEAAAWAAGAAEAAARAAEAAARAAGAARANAQQRCADIVRKYVTVESIVAALHAPEDVADEARS